MRAFVQVEPEAVLGGLELGDEAVDIGVELDFNDLLEAKVMEPCVLRAATQSPFEGEGVKGQLRSVGCGLDFGVGFVIDDADFAFMLKPKVDNTLDQGAIHIHDEIPLAFDANGIGGQSA